MADSENDRGMPKSAVVIIAVVASGFALYFGREFFQPIAVAVLLAIIFRPVVRAMERMKIPSAVGATLVVLALIGVLFLIGLTIAHPVQQWVKDAPETFKIAQDKIARIRQ